MPSSVFQLFEQIISGLIKTVVYLVAGLAHGVAEDLLPLHVDLSLVGPPVLVPQVRLKQTKINQSINQPINQFINAAINQSINLINHLDYLCFVW